MHSLTLFAYFAPDTMVPIASALATVVGVVVLGWQFLRRGIAVAFEKVRALFKAAR